MLSECAQCGNLDDKTLTMCPRCGSSQIELIYRYNCAGCDYNFVFTDVDINNPGLSAQNAHILCDTCADLDPNYEHPNYVRHFPFSPLAKK